MCVVLIFWFPLLFVIVCHKEQLYLDTIYFDMISNDTVDKSYMYICAIFASSIPYLPS